MELFIVIAVVVAAAAYIGWAFYKSASTGKCTGCAETCECAGCEQTCASASLLDEGKG